MEIIPFNSEPSFTETVVLENTPYRLQFNWNSRGEFWTMSIAEADGTPVIYGVKIVQGSLLVKSFCLKNFVTGGFVVFDPSGKLERVKKDDFYNGTLELVYLTKAEIDAL